MVSSLLAPDPPQAQSWRMPRRWADQQGLLERQHAHLEELLSSLIEQHAASEPESEVLRTFEESACRRLLWDLCLHLRLEERWLARWGVLCPGHRAAHREVSMAALADFQQAGADRVRRLAVLRGLLGWFLQHQAGPDARAYALAASASSTAAA